MRRLPLASLFAAAAVLSAAETKPDATPAGSSEPVAAADAAAGRRVSPEAAARLAAAVPKYVSPAAKEAPAHPVVRNSQRAGPRSLGGSASGTRTGVVQLPDYIVEDRTVERPPPRRPLTPRGRVADAMDRRPGLRFGPFHYLNEPVALAMRDDDLAAERRREEADLWSLYTVAAVPVATPAR